MALIKCPECGANVSDKSNACIHCGYPIQQKKQYKHNNSCDALNEMFEANKCMKKIIPQKEKFGFENITFPLGWYF